MNSGSKRKSLQLCRIFISRRLRMSHRNTVVTDQHSCQLLREAGRLELCELQSALNEKQFKRDLHHAVERWLGFTGFARDYPIQIVESGPAAGVLA